MTSTIDTGPRVALVTGGSGGIGRAVVERLAHDGFAVGVHYARNRATADEVVAAVLAAGGRAIAVGGDVADENAMSAAFDAVEAEFGGIDVVVNTAGIMLLAPIATLNLDDLDRMHRTNIRGTFVVAQQAARRVRPGGAIITFSTSVTRTRFATYGAYAASKAAVEAITPTLARELRGKDITVNAVAPRPDRHRPVPRRQGRDHRRQPGQGRPARATRPARRHRRDRRVPRRPCPLGQWPGHLHQRRPRVVEPACHRPAESVAARALHLIRGEQQEQCHRRDRRLERIRRPHRPRRRRPYPSTPACATPRAAPTPLFGRHRDDRGLRREPAIRPERADVTPARSTPGWR